MIVHARYKQLNKQVILNPFYIKGSVTKGGKKLLL